MVYNLYRYMYLLQTWHYSRFDVYICKSIAIYWYTIVLQSFSWHFTFNLNELSYIQNYHNSKFLQKKKLWKIKLIFLKMTCV